MSDDSPEYSLWLTFDEGTETRGLFRDTIADLATRHADSPVFEPHVTVVGAVDRERTALVETARSVAADSDPIEVTFGPVRCSTTRYQCVFHLVEPSLELFELYEATRDAVGAPPTAYNPHVSLVYSDMALDERLALAADLDSETLPRTGRLTTLEIVATGGPVAEWETVASVRL